MAFLSLAVQPAGGAARAGGGGRSGWQQPVAPDHALCPSRATAGCAAGQCPAILPPRGEALWRGPVQGIATLPADLKRERGARRGGGGTGGSSSAYLLLNKTALTGFMGAIGTVSGGIELRRLQAGGLSPAQAAQARAPLSMDGELIQPARLWRVCGACRGWLIAQQTLIAAAMLAAAGASVADWAPARGAGGGTSLPWRCGAWPAARFTLVGDGAARLPARSQHRWRAGVAGAVRARGGGARPAAGRVAAPANTACTCC